MTAVADETTATGGGNLPDAGAESAAGRTGTGVQRAGFMLSADGSYAACLATDSGGHWYPERWTLGGPEPYAVPLPCAQPEEPASSVVPLRDGRVLIRRLVDPAAGRHHLSLLYPSGPATSEVELGSVDTGPGGELLLVPPAAASTEVYALAPGERSTAVWLVHGGGSGSLELAAEVQGRCTGGRWLDLAGGLLAVDRELEGRTKAVAVDVRHTGEVSPLLQITENSNDRLLLSDPDSGLLLVLSDAPGHDRLGWGVLGSSRPVRFPEALKPGGGGADSPLAGAVMAPFAVQPGQALMPESCGVALRLDGPAGSWVGLWRPSGRELSHYAAPPGWLPGAGWWTPAGELRLPCAAGPLAVGVASLVPSAGGAV
ncbi:hypothetical protein G5C51_13880, partial [Streptomyces sp. A7024]